MTITEIQPRQTIERLEMGGKCSRAYKIFLAGTIDMGNSRDWQEEFITRFRESCKADDLPSDWNYEFYNPRRPKGFGTDMDEFHYQYNWEQDHLKSCDKIIMHFLGSSKSPVTMMELGQYLGNPKLVVICEPEFWKFDAVCLACERYGTLLYTSMDKYFEKNIK